MKSKIFYIISVLALTLITNNFVFSAEKYNSDTALKNMQDNFKSAYTSEWNSAELNLKLFNTVHKKFTENMKSLQFGTVAFQLASNRNSIIEKIQKDIFDEFRPEYEKFLGKFQESFYSRTAKNISDFVPEKKALEIVNQIGYAINYSPRFVLEEQAEKKLLENIWELISPKISNPIISSGLIFAGLIIFLSRGLIAEFFHLFKGDTQLARIMLSAISLIVITLGLYRTFSVAGSNSLTSRVVMYTNTKDFYVSELSKAYWSVIEPQLKQILL